MSPRRVGTLDDLWSGEMTSVDVGGVRVLLVHAGGEVRAYEDRCAHRGVRLSHGRLEGTTLVCPAHEWVYDAATGRGINPCAASLRPIPVRIEGADIVVDADAVRGAEPCRR